MDVEESLRSKYLYKILILLLKYIPITIALCYLLNTIAAIFSLELFVISHLAGLSLLPWIFMYLSAVVFRFCNYHKMFLWYILIDDIISIIDYYFTIPVNNFQIIQIHCSIAGISLFIILYMYVKSRKKFIRKYNK